MKKAILLLLAAVFSGAALYAQDAQKAAEEAAAAIAAAPVEQAEPPKPRYWVNSVQTNINFSQLLLKNWAAGGNNTVTLAANIDANANYAKDKMKWTNRLQIDYGFLYSSDKPILQKNKDRMYLESKWGYNTPVKHLDWAASFSFLNQFDNNYKYNTPASTDPDAITRQDWLDARELKSGFLSPAYITLGAGVDWTPWDWLCINVSPITGGVVIVSNSLLRETYGMPKGVRLNDVGDEIDYFAPAKFQLGAQLKLDAKFAINDNFTYTTQVVFFTDYLDKPFVNNRINWDNKVFWKLAKFFALTLSTNMIYDPTVTAPEAGNHLQWKEFFEFGFTWTIATKTD